MRMNNIYTYNINIKLFTPFYWVYFVKLSTRFYRSSRVLGGIKSIKQRISVYSSTTKSSKTAENHYTESQLQITAYLYSKCQSEDKIHTSQASGLPIIPAQYCNNICKYTFVLKLQPACVK